jgi:hypothetical protein
MARAPRLLSIVPWLYAAVLLAPGCRLAPREQLEDCHRLSLTLRSENAQLKDQMLALKSQNRDFSERAVDDARRLAQLEEANNRLETSVQAYQDERTRLESAYKELRASLPVSPQPLSLQLRDEDQTEHDTNADADAEHDPDLQKAQRPNMSGPPGPPERSRSKAHSRDSWAPSRSDDFPISSAARTDP